MPTFDLEQELAPIGGRVKNLNPDGTVAVSLTNPKTGDSVERNLNMIGLMRMKGMDPTKTDVKFNSPENAAEGADLSFATKIGLSLAGDEKSKTKYLQDQFGPDNVMDTGQGPVVKEAGVWKKADSSLLSDVVSSSPEIAAGMAGRAVGGALGGAVGTLADPVVGPLGTVVGTWTGAWAGGAAASALARYLKDKASAAVGIKSEYDAKQATTTLKTDFAVNMALDAAFTVPGVKVGAVVGAGAGAALGAYVGEPGKKGSSAASMALLGAAGGGAIAGVAKNAIPTAKGISSIVSKAVAKGIDIVGGEDRAAVADMAAALVPDTSAEDWRILTRSPQDAKNVMGDIRSIHEWNNLPDEVRPDASPVQTQMADVAEQAMRGARASSKALNDAAIAKAGTLADLDHPNVSIAQVGAKLKTDLASLGILDVNENGLASVAKTPSEDGSRIMQVYDTKSLNTLDKVLKQVTSVMTPISEDGTKVAERKLSFNDVKELLNGVDDILKSSGYYKSSEMALSDKSRAVLKGLRGDLNQSMIRGLEEQSPQAAKVYRDEAARSSAFLETYNDFALPAKLGGTDQKTINTVMRMFGGTQDASKADFRQMMTAAGVDANAYVTRLEQLNAANNLHPTWSGDGILNRAKSLVGLNPSSMANAMAAQTVRAGQDAVAQATPVSSASRQSVDAWAQGSSYLKSLKPEDRSNLATNPALLRQLLLTITNAGIK